MDESIRSVHEEDIILFPDGNWDFRENILSDVLENPANYEVVPYGTTRWHIIKEA